MRGEVHLTEQYAHFSVRVLPPLVRDTVRDFTCSAYVKASRLPVVGGLDSLFQPM